MGIKLYTRKGDEGKTSIGKEILPKHDVILEVIGTIDELNAFLGVAKFHAKKKKTKDTITRIQKRLFDVSAVIIGLKKESFEKDVEEMEKEIDIIMEDISISGFVLPEGKESFLHVARTVCRRAERRVVLLSNIREVEKTVLAFFNRLSDLLFALAIYERKEER